MTTTTTTTIIQDGNPYLNLLRALEEELFPVVAVERESGTFVFPEGIKVARGLSGLTIIFVFGVSAICFVKRSSRVRLSTTTETTSLLTPTSLFLAFTFLNSIFQLLYLSHLPDPNHAVSLYELFSSFALRNSFHKARVNLLLLATSPSTSEEATTASIIRVMAGPIEVMQKDLQRLRWSEIARDSAQVASQILIILFTLLLLSNVSSHLPRFVRPLRTLPQRIRFKRASSISKLPVEVVEEAPVQNVEIEEESNNHSEIRRSAFAVAALTSSIFLFTLLSNYILALDVLGRRWTAPIQAFGPTQLWSSYLYSSLSLVALLSLAHRRLFPSTTSSSLLPSSVMALVPLARFRGLRAGAQAQNTSSGYIVPPSVTPPPSPPLSIGETVSDKYASSSSPETSPRSIDAVPVLSSFPFPSIDSTDSLESSESVTSSSSTVNSSSSSVGYDTRR
ncbi:hypothetical protein JCM5350_004032 [Sporobolomyces pararoseus]